MTGFRHIPDPHTRQKVLEGLERLGGPAAAQAVHQQIVVGNAHKALQRVRADVADDDLALGFWIDQVGEDAARAWWRYTRSPACQCPAKLADARRLKAAADAFGTGDALSAVVARVFAD